MPDISRFVRRLPVRYMLPSPRCEALASLGPESKRLSEPPRPQQTGACNDDFAVNFILNCYLAVELTEKIKLLGAGESDEGRRIRNDDHKPKL